METLNVPFKPWEYATYTIIKNIENKRSGPMPRHHSYKATFETLKDYDKSHWKPGFVVKFGDGINSWSRDMWQTWFLFGDDKKKFAKENKIYDRRIPAYARNEYAIVLGRYKWTKYKWTRYTDYGTFIMMLTGDKIGHVRKYFVTCPYTEIGKYPYTSMRNNEKPQNLFHGVPLGNDVISFLENLTRELTNGR